MAVKSMMKSILIAFLFVGVKSIILRKLEVPSVVILGSNVSLECEFDVHDSNLYAIKWFKDEDEFYRYRPKVSPYIHIYNSRGITVDRTSANAGNIVLQNVNLSSSGRYVCEGSEDKPTFAATRRSRTLEVVVLPKRKPKIQGGHKSYRIGNSIKKNCSVSPSFPPSDISWYINAEKVHQRHVRRFQSISSGNGLHQTTSGLKFVLTNRYFNGSDSIKITCRARIYDIYDQSVSQILTKNPHWHAEQGYTSNNVGFPEAEKSNSKVVNGSVRLLSDYISTVISVMTVIKLLFVPPST
ncbi:Uncharacterised protein g8752 [Pycnogonum litorale]